MVRKTQKTMNAAQLMLDVEALIFASNEPITVEEIANYIGNAYEQIIEPDTILQAINGIQEKYKQPHYAFEVKQTAGGFQFLTKAIHHPTIAHINGEKYNKKLSATAMETLAIIAYRQPITKSEIEYIRGVSSDYAIHKLLEKELISIVGRDENSIGKPILYATSSEFFDYLGINSAAGLPQLKDLNTELLVIPTEASEALPDEGSKQPELSNLGVDHKGELIEREEENN